MFNILAGIMLCFLNVLFLCAECFSFYSVIIYGLILIDQICNTPSKYDCLPHFAVTRLLSIILKTFFSFQQKQKLLFSFQKKPRVKSLFHSLDHDIWEYNNIIILYCYTTITHIIIGAFSDISAFCVLLKRE